MDGAKLKAWRIKNKLTQKQIGEWLGLAQNNAVYKIEKGLRKITVAEERILLEKMAMSESEISKVSHNFEFSDEEISKLTKLASADGVNDPILWARLKIKAYLAELND